MQPRNGTRMLTAIAATAIGLGGPSAWAATRTLDAAGTGLAVVEACARHVSITPDPTLAGRISVMAEAANPEELAQLEAATTNGRAEIGLRPDLRRCWTPDESQGSFKPTLLLQIRVPATFPVSVTDGGLGDYALGAVGKLTVSASGMMTLKADSVSGDTQIDLSGAGGIDIGHLDAPRLTIEMSGAGSMHVRDGRIGSVHVSDSGDAQVRIDPVVETASLATSGVGTIALGGVRGALSHASSGLGQITVAGRTVTGSGDSDD